MCSWINPTDGKLCYKSALYWVHIGHPPYYRDAGTPHWKLIQIQKPQKALIQPDIWMDGHIILSLRGFEPVACGRMHCAQLWSARMITKKRRGRPDIKTDRWMDGHIISTGPHWGPLDPSVGINSLRRWTPTLEINTNTKSQKVPRKTGRTDISYCHSGELNPWPAATCAARNYGRANAILLPI